MKNNLIKRVITPTLFIPIGILSYIEAKKIRILRFGGAIGADFFPKILSVLFTILSFGWLIMEVIRAFREKEKEKSQKGDIRKVIPVTLFAVVFMLYIISLKHLGFIIPTIFLIFLNHILLRNEKIGLKVLILTFVYSVIVAMGTWYLFEKVFHMALPMGIIEVKLSK